MSVTEEDTPPTRWRPPSGSAFGAKLPSYDEKTSGPSLFSNRQNPSMWQSFVLRGHLVATWGQNNVVDAVTELCNAFHSFHFLSLHTLHDDLVTVPLTGYVFQRLLSLVFCFFSIIKTLLLCYKFQQASYCTQTEMLHKVMVGVCFCFGVIQKCWLVKLKLCLFS